MKTRFQYVIITGGSSGIGKAIASILVRNGSNIALVARTEKSLEQAKQQLEKLKQCEDQLVLTISVDVSLREDCHLGIEKAVKQLGGADLLITSAGIVWPGYFKELPIERFEETMQVNYFGSVYAIKAILPIMEKQGHGHIALISSGAGLAGIFGYSAYSPSKFAVKGFAEALRSELKPIGIQVSIAYPPDTDTPQYHEETKTKPPETREITGKVACWSADDVACVIVKGIQKKKFVITPGIEMTLLNRLNSIFAGPINWYLDRIVQKIQKP